MNWVRVAILSTAVVLAGFGFFGETAQALGTCAPQWDGEVQKENNLWYQCTWNGSWVWVGTSCWPYCETSPPCPNPPPP